MSVKLPKVPLFGRNAKLWGWTQTVALTDKMHVAYAFLNAGGFSSRHYHKNLWNRFVVIEGSLKIEIVRNNKLEIVTLKDNDILDVEPALIHRMVAISDVRLIEIYWPQEGLLDPEDIVREDEGGLTFTPTIFPDTQWQPPLPVDITEVPFLPPGKFAEIVGGYQPFYDDTMKMDGRNA